jgi:hypothetical protein
MIRAVPILHDPSLSQEAWQTAGLLSLQPVITGHSKKEAQIPSQCQFVHIIPIHDAGSRPVGKPA